MKLKKIASLMLAGIMAVSMLAGCEGKNTTSGDDNKDEQNQVTAASVADYANSLLSDKQKSIFEFENSAELTTALQKVAGNSKKFTSDEIEKYKDAYEREDVNALATELKNELKLDFDHGNTKGLASTTTKGTKTATWVYGVSGKLAEDAAVQLVVNSWAPATMNDDSYFPATISGKLDCDYAAEISAVKVTAPDDSKVSAWVVAIVVTQTAVEVANA